MLDSIKIAKGTRILYPLEKIYIVIQLLLLLTSVSVILISTKLIGYYLVSSFHESDFTFYQLKLFLLGVEKASYIETEYEGLIKFTEDINSINRNILISQAPFNYDPPFNSYGLPYNLTNYYFPCYQTRFINPSAAGEALLNKVAAMGKLYPLFFRKTILEIYSGYYTDEIMYSYPCADLQPTYSPLTRMWFYYALSSYPEVYLTEPYVDEGIGLVVLTFSKALTDEEGNIAGVSSVDIDIESVANDIENLKIFQTGLGVLVSAGGVMLNIPGIWKSSATKAVKIFQENITGITEDQWNQIKSTDSKSFSSFITVDGVNYYASTHKITPFANKSNVPQYLVLCITQKEVFSRSKLLQDNFDLIFDEIMMASFTLAIAVYLFLLIRGAIFKRSFYLDLAEIFSICRFIVMRALCLKPFKILSYPLKSAHILHKTFSAFSKKIAVIYRKEAESMQYYKWRKTRPIDEMIYQRWLDDSGSLNSYNQAQLQWRKDLASLDKIIRR